MFSSLISLLKVSINILSFLSSSKFSFETFNSLYARSITGLEKFMIFNDVVILLALGINLIIIIVASPNWGIISLKS